jgi:2,4-dienoyl-CoA reductase-like NADH-dependent reductase (Old Yellow Enzyme family)
MTAAKNGLFSPIRLRDLMLENRIAVSPMCQYSAVDGTAQPWHRVHIGSLSMSGAALVIMEATAVEARGRITPECLGIYSDENENALRDLLADLRPHSTARFGIQLNHAGRKSSTYKTWDLMRGHHVPHADGGWDVIGPSASAYGDGWLMPKAMDDTDLADVQASFVAAAQRADRCGFDLIELHAAHGYLLHSFVSPLSNQRTDAYGGSLEARMRYPLEVSRAVRAAWPAHKPMGVRINGSDWHDAGLTESDAVIFANALRDIGADYITPSAGSAAPGMRIPPVVPGYMVHFAEHIRMASHVPAMAVPIWLQSRADFSTTRVGAGTLPPRSAPKYAGRRNTAARRRSIGRGTRLRTPARRSWKPARWATPFATRAYGIPPSLLTLANAFLSGSQRMITTSLTPTPCMSPLRKSYMPVMPG